MLKRLHVGAEMKSIFVGVALVAAVTAFFAFLATRNPDFSMPDPAKVARLVLKRPQCEATVKDMLEKKLVVSIDRDETTINVAVDSAAWSRLPGTTRSAAALAVYCAKMPDDGLLVVAIRDKVTTQLVWLMVNGRDETSRRKLSGAS
jgi:hypothetical protein